MKKFKYFLLIFLATFIISISSVKTKANTNEIEMNINDNYVLKVNQNRFYSKKEIMRMINLTARDVQSGDLTNRIISISELYNVFETDRTQSGICEGGYSLFDYVFNGHYDGETGEEVIERGFKYRYNGSKRCQEHLASNVWEYFKQYFEEEYEGKGKEPEFGSLEKDIYAKVYQKPLKEMLGDSFDDRKFFSEIVLEISDGSGKDPFINFDYNRKMLESFLVKETKLNLNLKGKTYNNNEEVVEIFYVEDNSGNHAVVKVYLQYEDITGPVVTFNDDFPLLKGKQIKSSVLNELSEKTNISKFIKSVSDDFDKTINFADLKIQVNREVSKIFISLEDNVKNKTDFVFEFTELDDLNPTVEVKEKVYELSYLAMPSSEEVIENLIISKSDNLTKSDKLKIVIKENTFITREERAIGEFIIKFMLKDEAGNLSDEKTIKIRVIDSDSPVFYLDGNTVIISVEAKLTTTQMFGLANKFRSKNFDVKAYSLVRSDYLSSVNGLKENKVYNDNVVKLIGENGEEEFVKLNIKTANFNSGKEELKKVNSKIKIILNKLKVHFEKYKKVYIVSSTVLGGIILLGIVLKVLTHQRRRRFYR